MPISNMEPLENAIKAMSSNSDKFLYDVTIICTTDDFQAEYWMKRLSEGICKSSSDSKFPMVLAVSEDWAKGGAGNGLGTLYAYKKACALSKKLHDVELDMLLHEKKISAALFHTAGKGTRLAPLPASENNNKPGVKLPICHRLKDGSFAPITVLEAVVKQTGVYAPSRKGRLSVFWGDQVFIPSARYTYTPTHHVDIMCTLLGDKAPTAEEWIAQGLDKYGVIAVSTGASKEAAQVEKVDQPTAVEMLQVLGDIGQVGPSLGSFSVSAEILAALCKEYENELAAKVGKFDTDPHFWMPFTLPVEHYCALMKQKGVDEEVSKAHHQRMTKMKETFALGSLGLFGAVDVGKDACWWDYGQLKKYALNNVKVMDSDDESVLMKKFFNITANQMNSIVGEGVKVDSESCLFSSKISSGSISKSILTSVEAQQIEADGAMIINCTAKKIIAPKGSIIYNIADDSEEGVVLTKEGEVLVSVMDEDGKSMFIRSNLDTCGGKAWKLQLEGNEMSFEAVHLKNMNADVVKIEEKRKILHSKVSGSFS